MSTWFQVTVIQIVWMIYLMQGLPSIQMIFFNGVNFVWGAFQRIDVDVTSPTYGDNISDTNVYYDVWLTDELSTLAYATPILSNERYSSTTDDHVIVDSSNEIVGFKQLLTFYYDTETKELNEVTPNKLYYVKVQAKKVTALGTLVSEPTIASVYFSYTGASFEPPTIAKPPLHIKASETTEDGVTLNWKESWFEAISPDVVHPNPLATWRHQVWVDETTGDIYRESQDGTEYFALHEGEGEIQRLRDYLATFGPAPEIISRQVNLGLDDLGVSDVQYRFHTLPYTYVLGLIEERQNVDPTYSFEDYYNDLVEADRDGTATISWRDIEPYTEPDDNLFLAWREEGLTQNSSYLFILMPYRELANGQILYSHYPTPIVVSTDPVEDEVTPSPTVPTLFVTGATDTSITTTWKYNTDFEYDLMYGVIEDESAATLIEFEIPDNILDPNYPQDGDYFDVVVDDLFPLTSYYFWVRARQPSNNTNSVWSNPAIGQTLDTDVPIPPRGVGLAPFSRIEDYGYDNSVTENFIIVEWIKDLYDVDQTSEVRVKKNYSYIIEISDNAKFIDPIYVESSGGDNDVVPDGVEILEKNLIKVENLVPNRHYYIRVKTRVRVVGNLVGQLIVKDSVSYSEPIRVITLSSGSEYDGYQDPALNILPSKDYEMIYDDDDDMLVFRFRDDSIDESGGADNNVDQRLISKLIDDNIHEYVIDINDFEGKSIEKRRVAIPFGIIEAFSVYKVDMMILAGDMTIDLPSGAIIDTVMDQVNSYGVAQ